jgi:hypothetical protein
LIFEPLEQRIAKVIEKQSLDQFVHRASTTAMGERDLCVRKLMLPPSRALDALEKWRR